MSHGDKPSGIEEAMENLCFSNPLYKRAQKLVGNDKLLSRGVHEPQSVNVSFDGSWPLLMLGELV